MKVPTLTLNGRDISPSVEASFWSLVDMRLSEWGCWLWKGHKVPTGYGRFKVGNARYNANRVAYAIAYGKVDEHSFVCHSCDTPGCVRPDHLFLGSPADNCRDKVAKGRHAFGERGGTARLSEESVREILADTRTHVAIAAAYGVGKSTIQKIKSRINWRHLGAAA